MQLDSNKYNELQAAVANQVEEAGLTNHPPWNLKLVQVKKKNNKRKSNVFVANGSQNTMLVVKSLSHSKTCAACIRIK